MNMQSLTSWLPSWVSMPSWLPVPPLPSLPPLPVWNAVHPMVVHLPIGVLSAVPPMLVVTMFARRMRQPFSLMTLLVLALGAAGAFVATLSGEAAMRGAVVVGDAGQVLDDHAEMGVHVRNIFAVLAGVYAVVFLIAVMRGEKLGRWKWIAAHVVFLLMFAYGFLVLADAGHLGARLVHEYGVRAPIGGPPALMPEDVPSDDHGEAEKPPMP